MVSKELLEKAKKCSTREELLELAKQENVEVSDDEINAFLASFETNRELSDEELENVNGGTCHSGSTYYDLGIDPDSSQHPMYHPVITTAANICNLHSNYTGSGFDDCISCSHHYTIGPTIYCKKRSKEKDLG